MSFGMPRGRSKRWQIPKMTSRLLTIQLAVPPSDTREPPQQQCRASADLRASSVHSYSRLHNNPSLLRSIAAFRV